MWWPSPVIDLGLLDGGAQLAGRNVDGHALGDG